jgi:uncharacterized protein YgiM (DUF1202 family)
MAKSGPITQLAHHLPRFRTALFATLLTWTLILTGLSGCVGGATSSPTPAPRVAATAPTPTLTPLPTRAVASSPARPTSTYPVTPDQADREPSPTPAATAGAAASPEPTSQPLQGVKVSETPTETKASTQDLRGVLGSTREPAATGTPGLGTPVGTATTDLNVRAGPGIGYPVLGLLETGQSAQITGVGPQGGWWQIRLDGAADERGWVSAAYITARNTQNVPVALSPGLPTPPVTVANWRGEYFAGRGLTGSPVLVRDDPHLDFDWGGEAPAPGLPVDDFSVRWTRDLSLSPATYRFYANVDDGVRLWIDGELVIDAWQDGASTTYTPDVVLDDGEHHVVMEYYEHTGNAVAQLTWAPVEDYPDWKGEYYANDSLSGTPVLVRNDTSIDFQWDESPGRGVPADNFSARWTRTLYFPGYVYSFSMVVDDGARLWVDDRLIIDGWRAGAPQAYTAEIGLSEGPHNLKLEYFEFRYGARLYLNWQPVQDGPVWDADYFDNRKLDDDPVLERDDAVINFIWGTGSPGPDVPADNFSARWRQDVEFEAGTYIFSVRMDDGARLWVDDVLLIDSWQEGRLRLRQAEHQISGGWHRVKVEYFEHTGHAQIEVSWERK